MQYMSWFSLSNLKVSMYKKFFGGRWSRVVITDAYGWKWPSGRPFCMSICFHCPDVLVRLLLPPRCNFTCGQVFTASACPKTLSTQTRKKILFIYFSPVRVDISCVCVDVKKILKKNKKILFVRLLVASMWTLVPSARMREIFFF
jgi:hypothetical protein